ncbi:MAG: Glu/Leu/Phe/Val dehydrogenase [Actinomycetota bacterium]|nr:Glu/Leu/Phe/Val dehydrogenase [Actinomycetota bacterium]
MEFRPPTEVIRYEDPVEGFRGYVAFSGDGHRLAAGGFRVQPGLTEDTIVRLAQAMELKERLLGLAVDGAKAGIDYDPRAPRKREAMRRFLEFLRPCLLDRLSLGPDMGTAWSEIEGIAHQIGIPSVKVAVAGAQGLDHADFLARIGLLDVAVDGATLGERRAGHALAHATLGAIEAAGLSGRDVRVGIQGFGTLGRATAMALTEAGVTPTAVTDEHTCVHCYDDVPDGEVPADVAPPQRLLELPLDVLVLAACEDALNAERAARLEASVVVAGANLAISPPVERLLHERGVLVVPDFVGGCGGSASMDALFGPPTCPTVTEVLDALGTRMRTLVATVFAIAGDRGITPREAAVSMCERPVAPGKPYGRWQPAGPARSPALAARG